MAFISFAIAVQTIGQQFAIHGMWSHPSRIPNSTDSLPTRSSSHNVATHREPWVSAASLYQAPFLAHREGQKPALLSFISLCWYAIGKIVEFHLRGLRVLRGAYLPSAR
jgi:hypothetical protein